MNEEDDINKILKPLPIESMVAAPLIAAIDAQAIMNDTMIRFFDEFAVDNDNNIRTVGFNYTTPEYDSDGYPTGTQSDVTVHVPFIAIAPLPNLAIETLDIEFDLRIDCLEEKKSNSQSQNNQTQGVPVMKAIIASKSSNTRKSDSSARYSFKIAAKKQEPPEALMRIIDLIMQAAITPKKRKANTDIKIEETQGETNVLG